MRKPKETPREAAYRSLVEPLTITEVARELGISDDWVEEQIQTGRIKASPDGRVTGAELARYFAAHRRGYTWPGLPS